MSKITLNNLANLENETTATATIDNNNATIVAAMDNTLSRNGLSPNQMLSNLDMNSNRIINLVAPVSVTEPVTLSYLNTVLAGGNSSSGLVTGVPVSAAMQPVVNAADLSTARTLLLTNSPINVKWYGAVGDGVTDDTSAMQAAHNTGSVVFYPEGNYVFSTLSIASGGIIGLSPYKTRLFTSNTGSADIITFTGGGSVTSPIFRDFSLTPISTKTDGAGINFAPFSGEVAYANLSNIQVFSMPIGIHFTAANNWSVTECKFVNYTTAGIIVENTVNSDSGDGVIANSLLNTGVTTGSGILQKSGGGVKVTGCKFNGGAYGYNLQFNSTSTGDLVIVGNSIENCTQAAINFARTTGTGSFSNVVINGNQIALVPVGIFTDNSGFLSLLNISGNNIRIFGGLAIGLQNVFALMITGNHLFGVNSGDVGISTNVSCANGKVGGNFVFNFATPTVLTGANISTTF